MFPLTSRSPTLDQLRAMTTDQPRPGETGGCSVEAANHHSIFNDHYIGLEKNRSGGRVNLTKLSCVYQKKQAIPI